MEGADGGAAEPIGAWAQQEVHFSHGTGRRIECEQNVQTTRLQCTQGGASDGRRGRALGSDI
eukprot:5550115-Pleurochrysis_carterae.AAC.10